MPPHVAAIADGDHELRGPGDRLHPVLHRLAAKAVPLASAVGRVDDRPLENENIELDFARYAFLQNRLHVVTQFQAE